MLSRETHALADQTHAHVRTRTHAYTRAEGNEHGTRDKHTVNRRQRGGQRDSVHRRESSYWFNNESIYQLVNCCNIAYKPL